MTATLWNVLIIRIPCYIYQFNKKCWKVEIVW
jgi:hypothetical protein